MYGAILGDMIGAPYEFDRGNKTKEFPLFCADSHYTDDTVMTVAVAEALLDHRFEDDEVLRQALVDAMRKWGRRYPNAGYGGRFARWLRAKEPRPYGSYGNGAAMRVSAAGWLFDTLEETRAAARLSAEVTHNHPEGIRGAEATACAVFLARTGHGKDEIRDYIAGEFGYDLSRSCDEIRPDYCHVESCQETVPEAVTAFLEGRDFEDVIRTAVSLGGDCDTLSCIAGSIAEAFYGVPDALKAACESRLPADMRDILGRFNIAREHGPDALPEDFFSGNAVIEEAIARCRGGGEQLTDVLAAIVRRMREDGQLLIPVIVPEGFFEGFDAERAQVGDTVTSREDLFIRPHRVRTDDGKSWLAAFTSDEEYRRGETVSVISCFIDTFLEACADREEEGILLNPWGRSFPLSKELIRMILEAKERTDTPAPAP